MIKCIIKKWGNSLGVIIPCELVKELNLDVGSEVIVDLKHPNVLKELFGFTKDNPITKEEVDAFRESWLK